MWSTSQSNHAGSSSCGASSGAAPRSDAIVRSPAAAIETTTPVRPADGPRRRRRRARASSRRTSSPAASRRAARRSVASAPSDAAHAATFAACPPAPVLVVAGLVVAGHERLCRGARSRRGGGRRAWSMRTRTIVAWTATVAARRLRSFAIGGLVGAAGALATARRSSLRVAAPARRAGRPGGVRGCAVLPRARRRGGAALPRGRRDRPPGRRTRRSGRS